jgi:hypothetical protein
MSDLPGTTLLPLPFPLGRQLARPHRGVVEVAALFALYAAFARRPVWRVLGAAYPLVMLGIIVATGNHFVFDAAAGGAVVVVGWLIARSLVGRSREAGSIVPWAARATVSARGC